MKTKIILGIVLISLSMPASSHAFGLLRYIFDGISNQLGLDRGPVPKTLPKSPPLNPSGQPLAKNPDSYRIHIQAEGF
jgi:hypothetical protein